MTSSEKHLMEKTWENIQKKTFTGWVNNHLRKRNLKIDEIEHGFEDGLKLIALLEIISDDIFSYKYEKKPRMRIQKVGNVGHCLNFIKNKGVQLAGTGAEEIVDGNLKMILGMIWTIILRFQIQDISMEELSAKEALLLWCQKKTAGYEGVNVKNFHMSFQDGLAFCALIHKHRPDLINWDALDKSNKELCLQTAFDVAEKHLDVPKLLDPADLLDVPKPDERSVMTYVSLYYHVFASSQKAEAAGKRVGKVLDFVSANDKIKNDYLNRAQKLVEWINNTTHTMGERNFDNTLDGVLAQIAEFKSYRSDDKPPKYTEKVDLEALINGLQTKLSLNNRPPFVPPNGLSSKDIDALWTGLNQAEHERNLALREELRRQKRIMDLLRRFNALAAKLESWAGERDSSLRSTDYGDSISAVTAKINNLDAFESEYAAQTDRVVQLKSIASQLQQEAYVDMNYVHNRLGSIEGTWGNLKNTSTQRRQNLEAQLARLQQIENLLLSFAKKGLEFRVWLDKAADILTEPITGETPAAINEFQTAYDHIKKEKADHEGEFAALGELAQNCKAAGVAENTYSEVSFAALESQWNNIVSLISSRQHDIASEMQKQEVNEGLRVNFAKLASSFDAWTKQQSAAIEALSGDIQNQLNSLQTINHEIASGQGQFQDVQSAHQALENAHVFDNPHTALSIEGLKSQWDALNVLSHKKQQVLEKELLEQSGSGLSPAQLQEFRECFKHFDKDEDQLLSRLELGACLKSLGEDLSFEEGGKLDQILSAIDGDGDGKVTFEEFANYMERVSSGSDTPDSIKQAFKTLAGDKDFVTEADLRAVLPADKVTYCLSHMKPYPGVDGGYDYNTFTDQQLYGK